MPEGRGRGPRDDDMQRAVDDLDRAQRGQAQDLASLKIVQDRHIAVIGDHGQILKQHADLLGLLREREAALEDRTAGLRRRVAALEESKDHIMQKIGGIEDRQMDRAQRLESIETWRRSLPQATAAPATSTPIWTDLRVLLMGAIMIGYALGRVGVDPAAWLP